MVDLCFGWSLGMIFGTLFFDCTLDVDIYSSKKFQQLP